MIYVVYKVNEIDCDVCLDFLLSKLKKHNIESEIFCDKCHTLTIKLNDENQIEKVSKIISDYGYENKFEYITTKTHQHSGESDD